MIRVALTALSTVFLIACGGGSSSDSSDPTGVTMDEISVRTLGIDLVNLSGVTADFFIKESGGNSVLFDENNKVYTVNHVDSYYHSISWTTASPMSLDIGAQDTNSQTVQSVSEGNILNNGEKLWAIAWNDEGEMTLTSGVQDPAPIEDKYRLRLFAIEDVVVTVNSSAFSVINLSKGSFSNQIILDNCDNELILGANQRNICDLDIGKSYLLIVDGGNWLLAAEEDTTIN
ncbi:hypothetical protein [Photobacterium rosenbergii]|uniref:Uncharacterized protein n=1 Tax=Photobacterium rosenbergii TaxID=294936 RepID=A0ABU3ZFV6_9GAMM|nr:hypothetical protein [Photobacterium rosenbergii]MDV5168985.1 hypothetical protein [Photobacterium rosenbergii]